MCGSRAGAICVRSGYGFGLRTSRRLAPSSRWVFLGRLSAGTAALDEENATSHIWGGRGHSPVAIVSGAFCASGTFASIELRFLQRSLSRLEQATRAETTHRIIHDRVLPTGLRYTSSLPARATKVPPAVKTSGPAPSTTPASPILHPLHSTRRAVAPIFDQNAARVTTTPKRRRQTPPRHLDKECEEAKTARRKTRRPGPVTSSVAINYTPEEKRLYADQHGKPPLTAPRKSKSSNSWMLAEQQYAPEIEEFTELRLSPRRNYLVTPPKTRPH